MRKVFCRMLQLTLHISKRFLKWRKPQLIKGAGSIKLLAPAIKERKISSVLIVTGPNVSKRAAMNELTDSLEKEEIVYVIYNRTKNNPTIGNVEEAYSMYREKECNAVIAFGGGSPMDCAKGVAAKIAKPASSIKSMAGLLKVGRKTPPIFAIPTTAGTGSECTIVTVITDEKEHYKFAITDVNLMPDIAVLDPNVLLDMPHHITATTGMDALTHGIESYINIFSKATAENAREAIKKIFEYLPISYSSGKDIIAKEKMLEASYMAGFAFTRSYVGYVHAIAHAVGGIYGVPHGLANAVILPHVLELYGEKVEKPLSELADLVGLEGNNREKAHEFIAAVRKMNRDMDIPEYLDIRDEDVPIIINRAMVEANPTYPVPVIWEEKDFILALDKIRGKKVSCM